MKHFITFMTQQQNLENQYYDNVEQISDLDHDFMTSFPILIPMSNQIESGEEVKLTIVNTKDPFKYGEKNYNTFMQQLSELQGRVGFSYRITNLEAPFEESLNKQMKLLEDIVLTFEPEDIITADVSYGNKPSPMVLLTALSYADNFLENTFVKMLVYGGVAFDKDENGAAEGKGRKKISFINDVTSLFYMNSLVNRMSLTKPEDPLGTMKKMIEL